jgi:tetratricopeptide (TPR) repeat protein
MRYYGNIGRCLQFLEDHDRAMQFYRMSLEEARGEDDYATGHDKAYAFWWIGEVFASKGEAYVAAHFFKLAQTIWSKTSPPLARKMDGLVNVLEEAEHEIAIVHSKGELELRGYCEARLADATRAVVAG